MSDTKVVLEDLSALSTRFSQGSLDFETATHSYLCPPADSGDGACNAAIRAFTDMLTVLGQSMTAEIDDHAAKLKNAHDVYARTEEVNQNRFLWDNLNKDFE